MWGEGPVTSLRGAGRSRRQASGQAQSNGSGLPGEAVGRQACERTGARGKGFAHDRGLLVTEKSRGKHSGCSQRQGSETSSGPEAGAPSGSGSHDEWGSPVSLGSGSRSFPRLDTKSPPLLGPKGELGHGGASAVDGWTLRSWRNQRGGSAPSTDVAVPQDVGQRVLTGSTGEHASWGSVRVPCCTPAKATYYPPQPGSVRCPLRRAQPWVGRLCLSVPHPQPLSARPCSPTSSPTTPCTPTDTTIPHPHCPPLTPTTLHRPCQPSLNL